MDDSKSLQEQIEKAKRGQFTFRNKDDNKAINDLLRQLKNESNTKNGGGDNRQHTNNH